MGPGLGRAGLSWASLGQAALGWAGSADGAGAGPGRAGAMLGLAGLGLRAGRGRAGRVGGQGRARQGWSIHGAPGHDTRKQGSRSFKPDRGQSCKPQGSQAGGALST